MKKILKIFTLLVLLTAFAGGVYYFRFLKKDVQSLFMDTKSKGPIINNYPNFDAIQQVVKDGNITWGASYSSGLVRYDESAKKLQIYNKSNGLIGNNVPSILKVDDRIWIGIQGQGVQVLNTKTDKIEKTYARSFFVPEFDKDSSALGNPRLYLDSYTGDVYLGTINGAYRYDKKSDIWQNQTDLWGNSIWEMYFSRDAAWASGRNSPGGYMMDRKNGKWIDLTKEPGFLLNNYLMNTVADENSFYAFTRPANHSSCGDKNIAAMLESYTPGVGWQGVEAVNKLMKFDEEAVELRYEKPYILAIGQENVCGRENQDVSTYFVIKYNTQTKEATREPYKESDIQWLNGNSTPGELLVKKIEKETGIPSEKSIVYVRADGKPVIQNGQMGSRDTTFAVLDPATGTYDFSLWNKIKEHKEIKDSTLNFQILDCNQYNDPATTDRFYIKEYYMGMGGGPKEHIYSYSISKDVIEDIAIPDDAKNPRNFYDIFTCNDKEVIYPSTKGFVSYSLDTKKETNYFDGFNGTKYCDVNSSCFQAFDGNRKYFMSTTDRELGYFDLTTRTYGFYKMPDSAGNLNLWKKDPSDATLTYDPMHMNYATKDFLYFVYKRGDSSAITYVVIYDIKTDNWTSYDMGKDEYGQGQDIFSIRPYNGEVLVTTRSKTLVLDDKLGTTPYREFDLGNRALNNTGAMLLANDKLWFGTSDPNSGFWSYQSVR